MPSPTPVLRSALRKIKLTTKQVNKGYYKGNRSGSMGTHTKYGGYRVDYGKVRTYVVPEDLSFFKLTPFVTARADKPKHRFGPGGPMCGNKYIENWKRENGVN